MRVGVQLTVYLSHCFSGSYGSHRLAGKMCLLRSYQLLSTTFPAWDCVRYSVCVCCVCDNPTYLNRVYLPVSHPSHIHTTSLSHIHPPHTSTSSHPPHTSTQHPSHTSKSSHHHIIIAPSYIHIITSPSHIIIAPSHIHIITSPSHIHIITHFHIITSSHLVLLDHGIVEKPHVFMNVKTEEGSTLAPGLIGNEVVESIVLHARENNHVTIMCNS